MPAAQAAPILRVENVSRSYATAAGELTVLREASFELAEGESLALVGPSGSGKTTLLGLCAGLDQPTTARSRSPGARSPASTRTSARGCATSTPASCFRISSSSPR